MTKRKSTKGQTTIYKTYTYIYYDTRLILYIHDKCLMLYNIWHMSYATKCIYIYGTSLMLYSIWHMFNVIYLWFLFIGFPFNTLQQH